MSYRSKKYLIKSQHHQQSIDATATPTEILPKYTVFALFFSQKRTCA